MNKPQVREQVLEVKTFSEAWEAADLFFNENELTGVLFEYVKKPEGWSCSVVKQTVKRSGKEATYQKTFILRETAKTMTEAFRQAALRHLG